MMVEYKDLTKNQKAVFDYIDVTLVGIKGKEKIIMLLKEKYVKEVENG